MPIPRTCSDVLYRSRSDDLSAAGTVVGVNHYRISETDEAIVATADGRIVGELRIGNQLLLDLGAFNVIIEGRFMLADGSGSTMIDPVDVDGVGANASRIFGQELTRIAARRSGGLLVEFVSGCAIEVPADDRYETWQVSFEDGRYWVQMPGGELALWGPGAL